ncbi:MAG: flavin monoamine oxidase family protein [Chloroflexota bacterium]
MGPLQGSLTRRAFLHGLGVAGGAGAVLAAMEVLNLVAPAAEYRVPFDPPRRDDFSLRGRTNGTTVLVLGAGIAGLTAAYELEKAGYRCEIIEARNRPGGRNWTIRGGTRDTDLNGTTQTARFANGLYMNAGPARIPQHHTTIDYCRELGVPIEPFVNANADSYYFNKPQRDAKGPLTNTVIRHRAAKADTLGYISELLAKAVNQGALADELSRDDAEALVELLRAFGALGPNDRYVGSGRRGYSDPPSAGPRLGTTAPPYRLSDLLAARLGYYFPFESEWDQAMMMFEPVGGMDRIPYALANRIRGAIRYGTEVRSITIADADVRVVVTGDGGRSGTEIVADYCICTIPPMVLAKIPNNLPSQTKLDIASLQPMHTGKLGLQFRRRFWEEDEGIFGGITDTNTEIGTIWYPSSGYLNKRGIIIGLYNYLEDAEAFDALTPGQRERRALAVGRSVHGDAYLHEFETSFSAQWARVRYSEGGWVLWRDRSGPASETYRRLQQLRGRLYFAGDHMSYVTSWQHGAFESARLVVTELHQRVLSTEAA